ncbi:MAG: hypothetical protein IKG77_10295, partial [Prevotella sp.]|nr:hypothetical protein [Prevotella sp.]
TQQQQQKKIVKKGRKDAQVKMSDATIEVKAEAGPADDRPSALHAVVDQYGRITGLSSEGKPDPRQPLEFTIGRIFFDDHVATLEEVMNRKSLGYELFEIIYRPNTAGDPKWNYKDKEGILVFRQAKQEAKDAPKLIFGEPNGPEPLFVLDGKVVTKEQAMALDQSSIDHINVVKYSEDKKDLLRVYGDKFNADTSNGIIFIITKEYANSDERKKDYVVVVKSKDKEAAKENTPTATGTFTPTATGSFSPNAELDQEALRVIKSMPK